MKIKAINSDYRVNYANTAVKKNPYFSTPDFSSSFLVPNQAFCGAIKTQALQGVQQKTIPSDKTRLGANYNQDTKNIDFSVASKNASKVFLCVFDDPNSDKPILNVPMDKNDDVWSVSVPIDDVGGKETPIFYGYRAFGANWEYTDDFFNEDGTIKNPKAGYQSIVDENGNRFNPNKVAFDPCGRELSHLPSQNEVGGIPAYFSLEKTFEDNSAFASKSVFTIDKPQPIAKASNRRLIDEVIGEVHIKDLTIHEDVESPGTYKAAGQMAKKIADSGITMVEFLPLQEFDEKEGLDGNYWGYMTLGFFAPAKKYSSDKTPGGALKEFREMIDAFHKQNIKVCMDVVYNHTGEAGLINDDKQNAKQMSFALLDNQMYYKQKDGYYNNNTGCGNDINAASDEVIEMVADSVAYWANQGVDAFRFDLATGLMDTDSSEHTFYDPQNSIVGKLESKLEQRGINVKTPDEEGFGINLIAEPWTCSGVFSYQVGHFPKNWAEWNDQFRNFSKQLSSNPFDTTPGQLKLALEGSVGIFQNDNRSVNYVCSHDGFTLVDSNDNCNYPTQERKESEMKKQIALTLLAKGTPMIQIGDMIAHSKGGNGNTYCNDDESNYLNFSVVDNKDSLEARIYDFSKNIIEFRKNHPETLDSRNNNQIQYYKPDGSIAKDNDRSYWDNPMANILCYKINGENPIFVAISSDENAIDIKLPEPDDGKNWYKVCDTGIKDSFSVNGEKTEDEFLSNPYAVTIFEQK